MLLGCANDAMEARRSTLSNCYETRRGEVSHRDTSSANEMAHQHDGHCGHESTEHDHDHDHDSTDLGPKDNLFTRIDRDNVVALNALSPGPAIIKPWHERLDEEKVSDFSAVPWTRLICCFYFSVR